MVKKIKLNSRLDFVTCGSILIKSKRSQIWVETVIYTLIGLTIIAMILVMAVPRIESMKERAIVEQTISAMNELNNKILDTEQVQGNVRIVDFRIAKGSLEINSFDDRITYVLEDSKLEMSEPGAEIEQGDVTLRTDSVGSKFNIALTLQYNNLDLTYEGKQETKVLHAGATPHKIVVENTGIIIGDDTNIDINVN